MNGAAITCLDSAGAWLLPQWLAQNGAQATLKQWQPRWQALMDSIATREQIPAARSQHLSLTERVGRRTVEAARQMNALVPATTRVRRQRQSGPRNPTSHSDRYRSPYSSRMARVRRHGAVRQRQLRRRRCYGEPCRCSERGLAKTSLSIFAPIPRFSIWVVAGYCNGHNALSVHGFTPC